MGQQAGPSGDDDDVFVEDVVPLDVGAQRQRDGFIRRVREDRRARLLARTSPAGKVGEQVVEEPSASTSRVTARCRPWRSVGDHNGEHCDGDPRGPPAVEQTFTIVAGEELQLSKATEVWPPSRRAARLASATSPEASTTSMQVVIKKGAGERRSREAPGQPGRSSRKGQDEAEDAGEESPVHSRHIDLSGLAALVCRTSMGGRNPSCTACLVIE